VLSPLSYARAARLAPPGVARDGNGERHYAGAMAARVAVFGDVHADAAALHSILAAIDDAGIDDCWCLGDFCSGGPDPLECFETTLRRCRLVLAGNHERFVTDGIWTRRDGAWARAAQAAAEALGPRRVARLTDLPSHRRFGGVELVHGRLDWPEAGYLDGAEAAGRQGVMMRAPLLLFGHTHEAACWQLARDHHATSRPITVGEPMALDGRTLLNPGAGCDATGARWLELSGRDGTLHATWHRTAVAGHGGIPRGARRARLR
jgi:predicted phosphodiesterase